MIDAGQFRRFDTKAPDGVVIAFKQVRTADQYPDLTVMADADEERRAAYERDDWHFVGVQARAIVTIVTSGAGITYTLESAGLWGIESDSDEAYFDEVFEAEKHALQDDLRRLATAILEQLPAPAAPAAHADLPTGASMTLRKPVVRGPQADAVYREVSSGLKEAGWRLQMAVTECSPEGETARVEYWWRGIRRKSYRTPGLKLRWVQGVSVEMTRLDCLTIDDVNGG